MCDAVEGGHAMRKEKVCVSSSWLLYKSELNQENEGTEMRTVLSLDTSVGAAPNVGFTSQTVQHT